MAMEDGDVQFILPYSDFICFDDTMVFYLLLVSSLSGN